jgi:perosamine synthetase
MIGRVTGRADGSCDCLASSAVPIPYGRQTLDERDIEAVVEVLRGNWLTQGPEVEMFERTLADACEVPHAVAFSSGTAALHAAAFAAGVGPGDELLTSAITFAASANCGAYLGATPRFADIEADTWNVSAATIARAATDGTKVVVPVHFAGLPAPVREIRRALGPNVVIVEDAAHALGARADDEVVGSCRHSDMATFSFHPLKVITTAEGGAVTTRSAEVRERLRQFRNHGFVSDPERLGRDEGGWYREQQALGFNYRLSGLHCALGSSQLAKLAGFVARRNAIAERYRESLGDLDQLELPPAATTGSLHAYHLFIVRHRDGAEARRRLYDGLHERGILAQVHYSPVYWHPYYSETFGYGPGLCPEAERYYAGCLSLPCFPALSEEDQRTVIDAVRELA